MRDLAHVSHLLSGLKLYVASVLNLVFLNSGGGVVKTGFLNYASLSLCKQYAQRPFAWVDTNSPDSTTYTSASMSCKCSGGTTPSPRWSNPVRMEGSKTSKVPGS